jgi:hypothetical protein
MEGNPADGGEDGITPEQANVIMANWKQYLREQFGEGLRSVNEVRFRLTSVLKEFNKYQNKWLATLIVSSCESHLCGDGEEGDRVASYLVWIRERSSDDLVVEIEFSYNLTKGVGRILSVREVSDYYALSLYEVYDILALAIKLVYAFYATWPAVAPPSATRRSSSTTTPEQANKDVAEWKQYLRGRFTEEELRRVNEVRFKLARILKEFNKQQHRWLARVDVEDCEPVFCKEVKIVHYDVWVLARDTRERVAWISLDYSLTKGVKRLLGINGVSDGYVLGLSEFCDVLALALKLIHAFHIA